MIQISPVSIHLPSLLLHYVATIDDTIKSIIEETKLYCAYQKGVRIMCVSVRSTVQKDYICPKGFSNTRMKPMIKRVRDRKGTSCFTV